MKKLLIIALFTGLFGMGGSLRAQDNPNVGKAAPALDIEGWATAKTVTQAELAGTPYVMEFWATWCPPCRKSIPHLNELSQRLEPFGLKILGLSDEELEKVKPFAREMGMTYYVGAGQEMSDDIEYRGIPFAAVVDADGEIAWAGHPMAPPFGRMLWTVTRGHTPEALHPALDEAQEGPLGPAYEKLDRLDGGEAQKALEVIEDNLRLRLKFAAAMEGMDKYNALHSISTLYEGVPGVDAATEDMAELLETPEIKKEVELQEPLQDMQRKLEKIQRKAMSLQAEESEEAAMEYYVTELIPVFEEFLEEYPEHPEAARIQQSLEQLKDRLNQ